MEEKIKIYVTREVERILDKDAESFEFYKPSGKLNRNALLTRLIVNYSEEYHARKSEMIDYIAEKLAAEGFAATYNNRALIGEITEHVQRTASPLTVGKFDCPISLKPTRESAPVIAYIEGCLLGSVSLSEYFRNMFSAYATLSQDKRERIIFKEECEALERAIANKKQVFITLRNANRSTLTLSPYALCNTKEELHGYLVAASAKEMRGTSLRLSRVVSVKELPADAVFTDGCVAVMEKMLRYGPQFMYGRADEEAVIELTEKGKALFRKMYVHRPVPDRIEGDLYYFSCSHIQLRQYFVRFGEEAFVHKPMRLRADIFYFHKRAVKRISRDGYPERTPPMPKE